MSDLVPTAVIDIVVDPFFGGTILEAFVCGKSCDWPSLLIFKYLMFYVGMYTLLAAQAICVFLQNFKFL